MIQILHPSVWGQPCSYEKMSMSQRWTRLFIMAALRSRCGYYIFVLWFLSFFFFLAYSQLSQIGCLPYFYFYTCCGPSANLECWSEMCCTWLAGNAGPKKTAKKSPSGHHPTTLSGYIFATKARIDNQEKTCQTAMSPWHRSPAAEICWHVWGTPANFSGFRILAALLHSTVVVGMSQTLRR